MNFYLIPAFVKRYIQKKKNAQEKIYNEMVVIDRIFLILEFIFLSISLSLSIILLTVACLISYVIDSMF